MGIDYVGIGTDFDGDGTVCGMADASEMINFTRHLLARKYSERDIEKYGEVTGCELWHKYKQLNRNKRNENEREYKVFL